MSAHHPFGPSSLERRALCPGSFRMEKDLPQIHSDAAAEGTKLHEQITRAIECYCGRCECGEVDPRVLECLLEFECICGTPEYQDGAFRKAIESGEVIVKTETRLEYAYCGNILFSGTADVICVTPTRLIGIDWKFGHREVAAAENNWQGAAYALAAMRFWDRGSCEFCFFNPTIKQSTSQLFTHPAQIAAEIGGVIRKAENAAAPLIPGEVQCRYCKANLHGTCPAVHQQLEVVANKAEALAPRLALADLSDEELCQLKERCDLVANLSKRVDARIKAICEDRGECGNWVLKRTSGGRDIKDICEAFCLTVHDLSQEEFLACCSLSVAQLEKAFTDKRRAATGCSLKEAKQEFAERLGELVQQKPARMILELKK